MITPMFHLSFLPLVHPLDLSGSSPTLMEGTLIDLGEHQIEILNDVMEENGLKDISEALDHIISWFEENILES